MDPRIQVLIADRMQQIEMDVRNEFTQDKRKRSGRFNVTDNSSNVSYRRWPNEAILVDPNKKRVTFDELSQTQFILRFVKNVNDMIDPLTRRFMMAELYDLLQLIEATSWSVAKGAFIAVMHKIESGDISWMDHQILMQKRMIHTHAAAFAPQPMRTPTTKPSAGTDRRLLCKFHKAGTCREVGDAHTDPMMGITDFHEKTMRKK